MMLLGASCHDASDITLSAKLYLHTSLLLRRYRSFDEIGFKALRERGTYMLFQPSQG